MRSSKAGSPPMPQGIFGGVAADARKNVFDDVDPVLEAVAAKKSEAILSVPA